MKIKRREMPHYSTDLPVAKTKVKYRPWTVKEEKKVLLAITTGNEKEEIDATIDLLSCCADVDLFTMHPVDVEWLYLQIYKSAVSKKTSIEMPIDCGDTKIETTDEQRGCPEFLRVNADLEKDIEVVGTEALLEMGYKQRGDKWVVPFDEVSGMVFKLHSTKDDDEYKVMYENWDCFYDGDVVQTREEVSFEEFTEFMEELERPLADKIAALYDFQPSIVLHIKGKCPACGKEHVREVSGITDFLE